jgi:hypothetical protein
LPEICELWTEFESCRVPLSIRKEHLFAAAQVFVLTSYSENFGNTMLEAMRRRVPVVVTLEVGAADIARESGGGILVAGDSEPLGAALPAHHGPRSRPIDGRKPDDGTPWRTTPWHHIAAQMEALYEKSHLQHADEFSCSITLLH